jgi:hypothetical protein
LEKTGIFELAKFWQKVWKKFKNLSSEKSLDINQNCTSVSKISKNYVKFEFLSQKTLFLGQKVQKKIGKSLEKVRKVWKSLKISKIVLFQHFQDRKSQKTRSDLKTDLKVRIKVWNAGPHFELASGLIKSKITQKRI